MGLEPRGQCSIDAESPINAGSLLNAGVSRSVFKQTPGACSRSFTVCINSPLGLHINHNADSAHHAQWSRQHYLSLLCTISLQIIGLRWISLLVADTITDCTQAYAPFRFRYRCWYCYCWFTSCRLKLLQFTSQRRLGSIVYGIPTATHIRRFSYRTSLFAYVFLFIATFP